MFSKLIYLLLGFGADVVTVTSGTAGNAGSVAADLITYLSAKLLEVAELRTILDQFGEKHPLPSNNSLTIRFVRQEKLAVSTSPTQLTQGIAPDAVGITLNQFEATMEQYGVVVRLSDLAELTARHDIVQRTIYMLGLQAAETYDQLIFNVLDAATNTYRPNGRTLDTNTLATDFIGYNDLIELNALLQDQGATTMDNGSYVLVVPPQVQASMLKDPDWKEANKYAGADKIFRGQFATLAGMNCVVSNAPAMTTGVAQATSGFTNKLFSSFAIAKFAYMITDLQGLQMYSVAPGGHTDALQQSRKLGWKFAFKSLIVNQNWIRRVRTSGLSSANNP
jgi:N4-gp56 family major capsid protein